MRNLLICMIVVTGICLLPPACSKTSADQLAGTTNTCDTTSIGYTKDILPIMQQFCYSCHGNGNTVFSDGVNLQGQDSGYKEVYGYASIGYVVGNVTYAPGFIGMPYGKPKLDDCTINKIVAWVNQGYRH